MICYDLSVKIADPNELRAIPDVLKFFQLGIVQAVTPVSFGIGNHNYYVRAGEVEYVVKFLITQKPKTTENDLAIHDQLEKGGIRSPKYLINESGEHLYRKVSLSAVVSKNIEGVIPRLANEQLAYEIGKLLAQFHSHVHTLPNVSPGWMQPTMQGLQTKESNFLYRAELPKGITHGDMHLYNILVDAEKKQSIVALFDFEEVGEDLLIVDLGRSIIGVCHNEAGDALLPNLIKEEVAGYESIRQLTAEEKRLLSNAIKYAGEVCVKWFNDHGFHKYIENHQKRLASIEYT